MHDILPYPNITAKDTEAQVSQINSYLIQLKEALEFAFMGISSDNLSAINSLAKSMSISEEERTDQLQQVSSKIASDNEGALSAISQTASEIRAEVSKNYELKTDANEMYKDLSSSITQTADEINLSVSEQITETREYTDEKLKSYSTTTEMNSAIAQTAEGITLEVNKTIDSLQQQIDGAVETFSGSEIPTLSNYPAVDWTTDEVKDSHIGDLFLVSADNETSAGFYYRFEKSNGTYQWVMLKDNEITEALETARRANELAEGIADNLRLNYSTTIEMNSAIDQKANGISLSVDEKISTTRAYADSRASDAESNAKADTNDKLKSYSTTTEMNSAIKLESDSIKSSVSKNYETKTDANTTKTNLQSQITQNADSITSEVTRATNAENSLSTRITQTEDSITSEVARATESEEALSSKITQTAKEIKSEVSETYETKTDAGNTKTSLQSQITQNANSISSEVTRANEAEEALSSRITQTEDSITSEVERATSAENSLYSRVTQNMHSITSEVTRAKNAENELSSKITQNADSISSKVSKGTVSSEISQEADKITITGDRLVINATNITVDEDGNVVISGKLTATEKSQISTWQVDNNSIYNLGGQSSYAKGVFLSTGTTGSGYNIGGSPKINGWMLGAGGKFGITKDGVAYGSDVHLQGEITATSGAIGGWSVKTDYLEGKASNGSSIRLYPMGKSYNVTSSSSNLFFIVIYNSSGTPIGGISTSGWQTIYR